MLLPFSKWLITRISNLKSRDTKKSKKSKTSQSKILSANHNPSLRLVAARHIPASSEHAALVLHSPSVRKMPLRPPRPVALLESVESRLPCHSGPKIKVVVGSFSPPQLPTFRPLDDLAVGVVASSSRYCCRNPWIWGFLSSYEAVALR